MNKKEQKAAQRAREEDVVLTKVLWWILGAVVLEALLLLLNKVYVHYTAAQINMVLGIQAAFNVLAIVLPICFVILAVMAFMSWRGGRSAKLPGILAGVSLVLSACAVIIKLYYDSGISFLFVAVPAVTVLALIYYLYQREFFFSAVLSALGLLGVRIAPKAVSDPWTTYGYMVVLAVVLVAAVVFFRMLQTRKGNTKLMGKNVHVLPENANYAMLYVTCAVVAAVVIAALVLGSLAVLYGVLAAWLLILAVYYTVRLM